MEAISCPLDFPPVADCPELAGASLLFSPLYYTPRLVARQQQFASRGLFLSTYLQDDFTADRGPHIIVAVSTLGALPALFLALRIYCKLSRRGTLWWDDHVLVISWVCLFVSVILSILNVQRGFGKHVYDIPPELLPAISFTSTLAGTFSILAAVLSKTSFAITLLRILDGWMRRSVWFIIVSINIAMGLSALFSWVQCSPVAKIWLVNLPGTCWPPIVYATYGMVAAAYSGLMDIVLALLPWKMIWTLNMKKREKFGVTVAMSMGIFAGATALVKTATIPSLATGDFTYYGSGLVTWGTAESSVTIIGASIPILRVLLQKTRTRSPFIQEDSATRKSGMGRTHVTVTASRGHHEVDGLAGPRTRPDDMSDRSILNGLGNSIVQTNEVLVESHERGESDVESVGFELRTV